MKKSKLLIALVISFLLVNLFLIGFIIMRKPPHHRSPREVIIEKLNLNTEQIADYDELISNHRYAVDSIEKEVLIQKKKLYSQLKETSISTPDTLVLQTIAQLHNELETVHFYHFADIKKLCTPEQMAAYEGLINEITELFTSHKKQPHK